MSTEWIVVIAVLSWILLSLVLAVVVGRIIAGTESVAPGGPSVVVRKEARVSMVELSPIQHVRIVDKPWGHEEIFALVPGKFCGKVLYVRAGHSLSLQYHKVKEEVISVQRGTARLEVGDDPEELSVVDLGPGEGMHLPPGRIHRVTAVTDVWLLEASTTELDDVVRLADQYGREGTSQP
jgi:mannose-6-phosphate isomerase